MQIQTGIITISDRASKGLYDDLGGPALKKAAQDYGWSIVSELLVPDEKPAIQRAIREQAHKGCHLVLTTGGTGVALRDVTPEAVQEIAVPGCRGFGEAVRMESSADPQCHSLSLPGVVVKNLWSFVCQANRGERRVFRIRRRAIPHCIEVLQEVPTSC
jgi:molybdopterin adenylyltransferase